MLERKKELLKDIKQTEEKIRKVEYLRNRIEDGKIRYTNKQNKIKYKEKSLLK